MNQILRNDTNSSLTNCHERIAVQKRSKHFFLLPFFLSFLASIERRKKIIVTSKHGEPRSCELRSCSGGGFRFNPYPPPLFAPFASSHSADIVPILRPLYYTIARHVVTLAEPRGTSGFVCLYVILAPSRLFAPIRCFDFYLFRLANFEAKKKYANLLLFGIFENFFEGIFCKIVFVLRF